MATINIPPTGCPTAPITVGDPVSFETLRPTGVSWTGGPYWVGNNTLNGNPYTAVNDPAGGTYAFNPIITQAGDYCFTFSAPADDGNTYISECCFTVLSNTTTGDVISNCPTTDLTAPANYTINLNTTVPANATNITYTATSNGTGISTSGSTIPLFNLAAGNYAILATRCYDIATTVTGDKRTDLLANPERPDGSSNGFGSVTGGTNYVFPQNAAEFKSALNTSGSYICIEPQFANQTWFFDSGSGHANNITVDGSAAPGFTLSPSTSYSVTGGDYMFDMFAGDDNIIWHCIKLDGNFHGPSGTGLGAFNVRSTNIWFDHVEVTRFWDGAWEIARTGDLVTLSNISMYNTDKGILGYYPNTRGRRVTIFNSNMQATQRNPYNTGADFHVYNNYIAESSFGAMRAGRLLTQSPAFASGDAHIISEGNVFSNNNPADQDTYENNTYVDGYIESIGDIVNTQNGTNITNVSTPSLFNIPYTYDVMPASEVEAYVQANAGAIDKSAATNPNTQTICEEELCNIVVTAVINNPPTSTSNTYTTQENTSVTTTMFGSDPDGDPITYQIKTNPTNGSLSVSYPNATYTPNNNFTGTDSYTYCTIDDQGLQSPTATITINVTADPNQPPTSNSNTYTTQQGTPIATTLTGSDPDGDPITYQIKSSPANGTLSGIAPNLTYTPDPSFTGNDSYTYCTVDDQGLQSPVSTITITTLAACDCSGLISNWPTVIPCGVPITINYVMPAGSTQFTGVTNIPNGTVSNVTNNSLQLLVDCTGSGSSLTGIVQVGYTLNGQNCICNTTVTVSDPVIGGGGDCEPVSMSTLANGNILVTNSNNFPVTIIIQSGSMTGSTLTIPANGSVEYNNVMLDDNNKVCVTTACP